MYLKFAHSPHGWVGCLFADAFQDARPVERKKVRKEERLQSRIAMSHCSGRSGQAGRPCPCVFLSIDVFTGVESTSLREQQKGAKRTGRTDRADRADRPLLRPPSVLDLFGRSPVLFSPSLSLSHCLFILIPHPTLSALHHNPIQPGRIC